MGTGAGTKLERDTVEGFHASFYITDSENAVKEIANLRAMIELCRCNTFACMVQINKLKAGLSLNERMIPVLEEEIVEIEKFLRGEPNNWE